MTTTPLVDKEEMLRALDELPPEAIAEVREFIEFQKYKAQAHTPAGAIAIHGWLKDFRFDSNEIELARNEMWTRFQDHPA